MCEHTHGSCAQLSSKHLICLRTWTQLLEHDILSFTDPPKVTDCKCKLTYITPANPMVLSKCKGGAGHYEYGSVTTSM